MDRTGKEDPLDYDAPAEPVRDPVDLRRRSLEPGECNLRQGTSPEPQPKEKDQ